MAVKWEPFGVRVAVTGCNCPRSSPGVGVDSDVGVSGAIDRGGGGGGGGAIAIVVTALSPSRKVGDSERKSERPDSSSAADSRSMMIFGEEEAVDLEEDS